MKLLKISMIALLAVFIGACGGAETETAKNNKETAKTKDGLTAKDDNRSEDTEKPDEKKDAAKALEGTPSRAFQDLAVAWRDKDGATFKKNVSKRTLKGMEDSLEEMKEKLKVKNLDELIVKQMEMGGPFKGVPEVRNEKIDGDKATIEADIEGNWEEFNLVKEDGTWKVDLSEM